MITLVRFTLPLQITRIGFQTQWEPGRLGVDTIDWTPNGLRFTLDEGSTLTVVPPPGTIVFESHPALDKATNGPESSPPSAEPAQARASTPRR